MQLLANTQALGPRHGWFQMCPSTGWAAEGWQLQPASPALAPGSAGLAVSTHS